MVPRPEISRSSCAGSAVGKKQLPKVRLSPKSKLALKNAVQSAVRSPTGDVDPVLLDAAIAAGVPRKAVLFAAAVAREGVAAARIRRLQQLEQQRLQLLEEAVQAQNQRDQVILGLQQRFSPSSFVTQQDSPTNVGAAAALYQLKRQFGGLVDLKPLTENAESKTKTSEAVAPAVSPSPSVLSGSSGDGGTLAPSVASVGEDESRKQSSSPLVRDDDGSTKKSVGPLKKRSLLSTGNDDRDAAKPDSTESM